MGPIRYLVITLSDAATIANALRKKWLANDDEQRIAERLRHDTGANVQEIVDLLHDLQICGACELEGQAASCKSIDARKLGRRLRRLLERARGERSPDGAPVPDGLSRMPTCGAIEDAVLAERERCAKIVEGPLTTFEEMAAAIRAGDG